MYISFVILVFIVNYTTAIEVKDGPSIGIVGAGIGGATTAHYLHKLLGPQASIDIYEAEEVGGRLATVKVGGREYESGGSIIHPKNEYMVNFTRELGLVQRDRRSGRLAIYDGKEMVFDGSSTSLVLIAQLLWHYGWDIFKIRTYVQEILQDFRRIYDHQDNGHAFTTVDKLLSSMSSEFPKMLHQSIYAEFHNKEYSDDFIHQMVRGGLRGNYGQSDDIQSFVGAVSMAGIEPGLWSVKGGNKRVPEKLLEELGDHVVLKRLKVSKITLLDDNKFNIQTKEGLKTYDFVVVSVPLHDNIAGIEFKGFPPSTPLKFPQPFHRTVATFIAGYPNTTKFGYKNLNEFPEAMFTSSNDLFFNSIGKHLPVDYVSKEQRSLDMKTPVYKIFSQEPLTKEQLDDLFPTVVEKAIVDWTAAYPHYPSDEQLLPPFQLHKGLYYVNAIELASSAMEMCAIGGRNVALLLHNQWSDSTQNIDSTFSDRHSDLKKEL